METETPSIWPAFSRYGIELEYMVLDQSSLQPAYVVEPFLNHLGGEGTMETPIGPGIVSNELAAHVLELKVPEPVPDLASAASLFPATVAASASILSRWEAMLVPGPMHPWFDPDRDSRLWTKGNEEIYAAYDRIFGCRGHGWTNLQSCHINLPFSGDEEFRRLHTAILLLLPLMPALTAASPFLNGRSSGFLDTRLEVYSHNQKRIPSISGNVIPEVVASQDEYMEKILAPMYRDIAPFDPEGFLQHEWLNSRGAIARFDRSTIEIRLLDVQECPNADLSIAALLIHAIQQVYEETWGDPISLAAQSNCHQRRAQLWKVAELGMSAPVTLPELLRIANSTSGSLCAGEFWRYLFRSAFLSTPEANLFGPNLELVLSEGNLASRLLRRFGAAPSHDQLTRMLRDLADCLHHNRLFR